MYAILSETKETIALKKKQIEENQTHVNNMAFEMANKVQKVNSLKMQVGVLEDELYRLEKQVQSTEQKKMSATENGCCLTAPNGPKRYDN